MSDACECVDGHNIDCSALLQYRFPSPPKNRIGTYWNCVKKSSHAAFLRVAVFLIALYCIFPHFDYLKMRAKGKLSRWFFVPEWRVLREDKDGHALGSIEQIYEPVEEYRRMAAEALVERKQGADARSRSQSPPLSGTSLESSAVERRNTTQESADGVLIVPPDIDPETLAAVQEFVDAICEMRMTKKAEVSGEPCAPSPTQMQEAGPSRIDASPFSQYSIHPDSPEPFDRDSVPTAAGSKTREPPPPSLHPSRKIRPFKASAHSQGNTIWMATASYEDLPNPPEPVPEDEPGILYIHRNLSDDTLQVWLLEDEGQWTTVQSGVKIQHPTLRDRYLAVRLDGTPSWITLASWYSMKRRVNIR